MLKKIYFVFALILFIYLVLPGPDRVDQFKSLPDSIKSDEPGDTTQIQNVVAYFTDYRRKDLIPFYKEDFTKAFGLVGFVLPKIYLNHPPEYSHQVVRPYINSWYLEEFVHPLRESLYVNGWEPYDESGDKRTRFSHGITVNNRMFTTKVTLRYYTSPLWARIITGLGILTAVYLLYKLYIKALVN